MPSLQQPPPQVWRPSRTYPSNAAATSSIERFDPTAFRCDVLQRFALESSQSEAERERFGLAGTDGVGDEWEGQLLQWLASVAIAAWRLLWCHHRAEATETTAAASEADNSGMDQGSAATLSNSSGAQPIRSSSGVRVAETRTGSIATGAIPVETTDSTTANAAGSTSTADAGKAVTETTLSKSSRRIKAAVTWVRGMRDRVEEYVKLSIFWAFPKNSLFADPAVEELFQRHCMQYWTPRFDWSVAAVVQMLAWDLVAGRGHRLELVLCFYAAFAAMVVLHKVLFLALRGRPQGWRRSRGLLLFGFLLGRSVVCHPLLPAAFPDEEQDPSPNPDLSLLLNELAQSGVVATGLIFALQLHKLDTLLVCATHGVACACWAGFAALHLPSSDTWWHHLAAVHLLVACVCVWQQHDRERLGRHSFELELLMERARLLRASENLSRQGTQVDFGVGIQLLYQARSVEHLNF